MISQMRVSAADTARTVTVWMFVIHRILGADDSSPNELRTAEFCRRPMTNARDVL